MPNDLQQKSRLASAFLLQQDTLIISLRVLLVWPQRQEQQEHQRQELAQVQQPVL